MKKIIFIVILFTLLSLGLRGVYRHKLTLWTDELHQLRAMNKQFKNVLKYNLYGDHTSFVGEYLLTYPFVKMNNKGYGDAEVGKFNKWIINIPHILINIILFYFLFRLSQIYFKTWVGWAVCWSLFCFNTSLVHHAFEFRPYAVLPFLALASLYFCKRVQYYNKWQKGLTGLFFFATINFHAFGILIFLLPCLYVMLNNEKFYLKPWKFFLITFLISFPVWCYYAKFNTFGVTPNYAQSIRPTFQYLPNPMLDPVKFIVTVYSVLIGHPACSFFMTGSLLPLALFGKKKDTWFLFLFVFLPITLILLVDIKTQYWFIQRQWVWVIPFFHIYMGKIWDRFAERIT